MLERGLERAIGNIAVAAYVEIEAFAIYNLVCAMEKGVVAPTPVWTDVKTFPAHNFRGKVHGFIGGYPCQPFSAAGSQEGEEDPRHLWPYLAKHIAAIKPVWCFFENVANHLNIGFETVHRELSAMGYYVEGGVHSAEEVGATHQRKRMFILAVENSSLLGVRRWHTQRASARKVKVPAKGSGNVGHPQSIDQRHEGTGHTGSQVAVGESGKEEGMEAVDIEGKTYSPIAAIAQLSDMFPFEKHIYDIEADVIMYVTQPKAICK